MMIKEMKRDLTIWQFTGYMSASILMLCVFMLLLSSCTEELLPTDRPNDSGKKVAVRFALTGVTYGDPEIVTRRDMQPETVVVPMGEYLYMYATLEIDPGVKLRATSPLGQNKKVRIVAYKNGTAYDGHADYTVINSTGDISGGSLQVEEGQTYKFVAYSYNSGSLPVHNEIISGITPFYDLLWGASGMIQIQASTTVNITMSHKFSQVSIQATTEDNDPGERPAIANMTGVELAPGQSVNLTVANGTYEAGFYEVQSFQNTWAPLNSTTVTGAPRTVFTNGANEVVVRIGSLSLIGYANPFTKLETRFKKVMHPGISYLLKVSFRKGSIWAGSNIYWDGSKLTFDPAGDRKHEHYQGVFFKWGSLIGIQPCMSGNTTAFANAIYYYPVYNSGDPASSTWSYSSSSNWATIVPVTDASNNTDRDNKYLTDMGNTRYSQYTWQGDICQYISETATIANLKGYRMPTSNELGTDLGIWTEAKPGPVAGGWTRIGADNDFVDKTNSIPADAISNAGKWINPAPSGATYQGAYFPASGWRDSYGTLASVAAWGNYWSSTIGVTHWGYTLNFYSGLIRPNTTFNGNRESATISSAMPVRCVKKRQNEN
jgi:hypothetical protein